MRIIFGVTVHSIAANNKKTPLFIFMSYLSYGSDHT